MNGIPRIFRVPVLTATLLALVACTQDKHVAEVNLKVDGQDYSYTTHSAETDRQLEDGRTSVYLLRGETAGDGPYLGIRYYAGNPIARLWLRYAEPGAEPADGDLIRYDCFVPGTLSDGRETLSLKRKDGRSRERHETGDPDCNATVEVSGDALTFTYDATLFSGKKKAAEGDGEDGGSGRYEVTIQGMATVQM